MRSYSEDGKVQVQKWLRPKQGNPCNDPRPAASRYNQDETDDEYEEAREETEHNLPKELTELEDAAEDHDRCDQKTDIDKASHPKIYDTDPKPQRATTGNTRDNDGRDDRTEDGTAPKKFGTDIVIPTLGAKRREEHAPADRIPVSVPGHTGEGRREEHSRAGQIVNSGPMSPREIRCSGHRGGDRKDEQRQSDWIVSKPEKDNGLRTVMEIPQIGRGTAFKHSSPPRNMPGRAADMPIVAPARPYKGKKEEQRRCGCVVL